MDKAPVQIKEFNGKIERGELERFLNSNQVAELVSVVGIINSQVKRLDKVMPSTQSMSGRVTVQDEGIVYSTRIMVIYRPPYQG